MSEVYRARHVHRATTHALKILDPRVYAGTGQRYQQMLFARLRREGRLQQEIRHPNIVHVEQVMETPHGPALLMEWVDGPTLDAVLAARSALRWQDVDDIAQGLLRALAGAQQAEVVHRDVKPSNVLLAREHGQWVPKLTDFGLAKDSDDVDDLTLTGQVMGTPGYMPPRQMQDAKHVDTSVDTYAMGAVLYEIATGRRLVPVWQRATPDLVACALERLADTDVPVRMQLAIAMALRPGLPRFDAASVLAAWQGNAPPNNPFPSWRPVAGFAVVGAFAALWWGLGILG